MNLDSRTIDDIVTGVLQQLGAARTVVTAPTPAPANAAAAGANGSVVLQDAVITEDVLQTRAGNAGRVQIAKTAVITPSGRDWLRRRSVTVERVSASAGKKQIGWRLVVVDGTSAVDKLNEEAERSGWETRRIGDIEEAVVWSVSALSDGSVGGVVVLTNQAARAACRANRNAKVRAAVADSASAVKTIQAELGANLLAVAPGDRSYFELRNLLKMIAAGGPPAVPTDW